MPHPVDANTSQQSLLAACTHSPKLDELPDTAASQGPQACDDLKLWVALAIAINAYWKDLINQAMMQYMRDL